MLLKRAGRNVIILFLDTRKARQLPASVTLLFNISLHSQKQLRQFKYTIVSLVNTIVSGLSYTDIQRVQDMEEGGVTNTRTMSVTADSRVDERFIEEPL